jgi:hypothetical protein
LDAPAGRSELDAFIAEQLSQPAPAPALVIARLLAGKFPGAAIFLYGSGITVSAEEDPAGVMYDYYVMAPDYRACFTSFIERMAARLLPPNVYYIESPSDYGVLRAKYAVLSADHLDRLVSMKTFHSYFWARFAQPMRVVAGPEAMRARAVIVVREALATFLRRAAPLAGDAAGWREIWLAGLLASYKSELRAEGGDRAERLVDHMAGWAERTAQASAGRWRRRASGAARRRLLSSLAWRLRSLQGAILSAARLLKATATFKGGIEYIAWKIARHSGIDVGLRDWERRHPFIAAPIVALRYYRLRGQAARPPKNKESLT